VELVVSHLLAVPVEASSGRDAFALRAAREDHAVSVRLELPCGFEAQAAVRPGDEGDGPIRFFVDHPTPSNEAVRLVVLLPRPPSDVLNGDNGPKALPRRRRLPPSKRHRSSPNPCHRRSPLLLKPIRTSTSPSHSK